MIFKDSPRSEDFPFARIPHRIKAPLRRRSVATFLLLAVLGILSAGPAPAAITVLDYYRLGEDDPGAQPGGLLTTTSDAVGGKHLSSTNPPTYTPDVAASATNQTGSRLSASFSGGNRVLNGPLLSTVTDNFGLEAWVKPNSVAATYSVLAYNGDPGASGLGFVLSGNQWQGLAGGVTYWGGATATIGAWTHLAIVRDQGTSTLYVNGVAAGTHTAAPNTPTGNFWIGSYPPAEAPYWTDFDGLVDQVRCFTFSAGQFSHEDLLLNAFFVRDYYPLGEADAGAVAGNPANAFTLDLAGTNHLASSDAPVYSCDVAQAAAQTTGSRLAMSFDGTNQYLAGSLLASNVNNFGLEAWVKPSANNVRLSALAYNGSGNTNGWGLYFLGNQVMGLFAQVAWVPFYDRGAALPVGVWTHVALVRSGGVATLYTNGVAFGASVNAAPLTPAGGRFGIGADPNRANPYGTNFNGIVDQVRVFTFQPGQFSPDRLLLKNPPASLQPPAVLAASAVNLNLTYATLSASVIPNGAANTQIYFEYGLTTNYGSYSVTNIVAGRCAQMVNAYLNGLTAVATYHYRAVAFNAFGADASADQTFTLVPGLASASTLPASAVTANTAILNATVFPNGLATTAYFQHGQTTNFGGYSSTNLLGSSLGSTQNVAINLAGLSTGGSYYFRVVADNAAGVAYGGIHSFGVVTNTADSGPGSLRQAFADAPGAPGSSVITFDPGLNGARIRLLSPLIVNATNAVTVDATALPLQITLDGGHATRFFQVANSSLTLRGLTLTNGVAPEGESGGAINSANSTVTLARCIFSGNEAGAGIHGIDALFGGSGGPSGGGGAIGNSAGTLIVTDCTFSENSAGRGGGGGNSGGLFGVGGAGGGGGAGGAIYHNLGTVTLANCTFSGNRSGTGAEPGQPLNNVGGYGGSGGAIFCSGGKVTLTQCTLNNNRSGDGGAARVNGNGGGEGGAGGAIYTSATTLTLTHCTVIGNNCGVGGGNGPNGTGPFSPTGTAGGVLNYLGSVASLANSIVALNTGERAGDIYNFATVTRTGMNLIRDYGNSGGGTDSGPTALTNAPLLAALGNYGGPSQTMPPLPGSPAFDGGDDSVANTLATDQRGFPRLVGAHVDLGAAELSPLATTLLANNITITGVTLNGTVNPGGLSTSYYFEYGTTTNYGSTTPGSGVGSSSAALPVADPITGLQLSTLYHFRIVAANSAGIAWGADLTFTSGDVPPTVSGLTAVVVGTNAINGSRSVRLTANVNPNHTNGLITTVYFHYGLSTAYGGTSGPINFPAGLSTSNVTVTVDNFSAGFTYHWKVAAANIGGGTTTADQTFTISAGVAGDANGDGLVSQAEFDSVYANYVTNTPFLFLTNVAGLGGTNVSFALSNVILGSYTVESTTNLVNWQPLGLATPRYLFTDTNAPALPQRYYRLRYP